MSAVRALLDRADVRLLTLTGPGGVGKTRLAIEAVSGRESDADHLWFVPLATLRDPALALPAIATALGLRQQTARTADESLRALLRGRQALLVLDNVEQFHRVGVHLTGLLAACPGLTILTTSRVPLRISGEFLFAVPPLPLPAQVAATIVPPADAVRLFVARARTVDAGFRLTGANAGDIAAICRQLDGLPLAIELAAARVAALPLPDLRRALRHRLPVLTGGPRDAPDRLRTMRDAIAWSHDLLDDAGQRRFRRLAVFTGGFTLDAAACVLGEGAHALDGVASLVEAHLVERASEPSTDSRFTMLETIREFGLERLAASGEEADIRARHAGWFLAQAERADYSWYMPLGDAVPLIAGLAADHANLRAARDWFVQTGDMEAERLLAGRLGALWVLLGQCREGREWLEQALGRGAASPSLSRARALAALTWVAHRLRDFPRALATGAEGLALARSLGSDVIAFECQIVSGSASIDIGDFDTGALLLQGAMASLDALDGQPPWTRHAAAKVVEQFAKGALLRGDLVAAKAYCLQAVERQRALGYEPGTSDVYGVHVLATLGDVARASGDQATAMGHYQSALALARRVADVSRVGRGLANVAGTLAATGQYALAARLFGASEAYHEVTGYRFGPDAFDRQRALGLPEPWQGAGEPFGTLAPLRAAVLARGAPPFPPIPDRALVEAEWAVGRRLGVDEAIALALAATPATMAVSDPIATLSTREREVLRMLIDGCPSREIAAALSLSERTVEGHVQHVLAKLGVASRTAAAVFALRHGFG